MSIADIKRLKKELYYQVLSMTSKKDDTEIIRTLARVEDLINMIIKNSTRAAIKGDNMVFEIYVKEKVLEDGRKFNVYSAIERHLDGTKAYYDVKFTKEVTCFPVAHAFVTIDDFKDWNYDKTAKYPTIWIKAVNKIQELDY